MRKMLLNKSLSWILLAIAMTAGLSCKKHDGPASEAVRFSMSVATTDTRTSYSGEGTTGTDGLLTKERINWKDGDLVTIYSPEAMLPDWTHTADYQIISHTTLSDNLTSRAMVSSTDPSGKGLTWEVGTNHFYAMYPSASTSGFSTKEKEWIGLYETTMKGTIPSVQTLSWSGLKGTADMKYAWMFAKETGQKGNTNPVNLVFHPKFTAFEFTVGSGENASVTLSSFKMKTTKANAYLAGNFSLNGGTEVVNVSSTEPSDSLFVQFPNGTVVTPENSLTFTVFALPVDLTNITITFTGTEIGTRTLALNDGSNKPLNFTACTKYRIYGIRFPSLLTAVGEDILWDLEAHGESINWY